MDNKEDNIFFTFKENREEIDNTNEIEKMLYELEQDDLDMDLKQSKKDGFNDSMSFYFFNKEMCEEKYGINNAVFYSDYTVKDLLKICNYYDIEKHVKSSKCKKQDIIGSIIYFESLPENFEMVNRRHAMWSYMEELTNDPKMKKYIIW